MNSNKTTKSTTSASTTLLPDVQFILSRPSYPLGGTIVGTIVIRKPPSQCCNNVNDNDDNDNHHHNNGTIHSILESATVYIAGYCKIDSRWHNIGDYIKIYGTVHPYLQMLTSNYDLDLISQGDDTVCFWATNGLELLQLKERQQGLRWNDPIKYTSLYEKGQIVAYTFRVDVPQELPHSMNASTCKYYYTANLLIKTKGSANQQQQQVLKRNFQLTTNPTKNHEGISTTTTLNTIRHSQSNRSHKIITSRVKFGNCIGMGHSNGLPIHVSASEIHRPTGQMIVKQVNNRYYQQDMQVLRISTQYNQPVCIMTIIGLQSICPGSQIHFIWDFPKQYSVEDIINKEEHNNNDNNNNKYNSSNSTSLESKPESKSKKKPWIPCVQVCGCIQGEEYATYEDGTTKRTQSFILDTCHSYVEPGVTNHVSKTMIVDSSDGIPCPLHTDIMQLNIWCQIDFTVIQQQQQQQQQKPMAGQQQQQQDLPTYNNLTVRLPCRIRHNVKDDVDEQIIEAEEEEKYATTTSLLELLEMDNNNIVQQENDDDYNDGIVNDDHHHNNNKNNNNPAIQQFPIHDIRSDLKILALTVEDMMIRRY